MSARIDDLIRFYEILATLEQKAGGKRMLSTCNGRMSWPSRGVYFFTEGGENRTDTGEGLRIVRVGTHALKDGSKSTLWGRLSQHKGTEKTGGGNHRGSIFRLIVGTAIIKRTEQDFPTWGIGSTAKSDIRKNELPMEQKVSKAIRAMQFLWLPINDAASPESLRGYIERNSIALLSNYKKDKLDPPSNEWLGHDCNRKRVRESGLWNQNHVDENYNTEFLDTLEELIKKMEI